MSTSTSVSAFQTLNLSRVKEELSDLYCRVSHERGRVEILSDTGECDCVLISKAELDGLERALALLSDSGAVREMSERLLDLADVSEKASVSA